MHVHRPAIAQSTCRRGDAWHRASHRHGELAQAGRAQMADQNTGVSYRGSDRSPGGHDRRVVGQFRVDRLGVHAAPQSDQVPASAGIAQARFRPPGRHGLGGGEDARLLGCGLWQGTQISHRLSMAVGRRLAPQLSTGIGGCGDGRSAVWEWGWRGLVGGLFGALAVGSDVACVL